MNKLATVFSLVLALLIFGGAVQSVEAKSVSWQFAPDLDFYYFANVYDWGSGSWTPGLANPDITVRYHADVINCDTGESLGDGASVPTGTRLRFAPRAHQDTDIYWFGTGHSNDSPYGHWVASAGVPATKQCLSQDFVGIYWPAYSFSVYVPLNINPPDSVTVTQGGTAVLGAADEVGCREVETAGTIVPTFTFGETYGKFYYRWKSPKYFNHQCIGNDIPMRSGSFDTCSLFLGCPDVSSESYILSVPTQTITFNLTATANNNPPTPPTITGPQQTYPNTQETYCFVATDPDNDTIQYGIDWNNDGDVNIWTEFVPSGTQLCRPYEWDSTGLKTFQVVTKDSKGAWSTTWTPYEVNVITDPTTLTNLSCSASPNPITAGNSTTWSANITGGKAPFTYAWRDIDGTFLGGNSTLSRPYLAAGDFSLTLTVTDDNGSTLTRTCTMLTVEAAPVPPPTACTPNLTVSRPAVRVGERVTVSWDACLESCTLSQSGIAPQAVTGAGSQDVTLQGTTDFTLTCPSGTETERVRVLPKVQET